MKNEPRFIVLHCTDISHKVIWDQFKAVDNYHKSQGYPKSSLGYNTGYHRLITGGKNYKCKEDWEEGAHTNQVVDGLSMNLQSLGICIGFDGDVEQMPDDYYTMLQDQIWEWQDKYNIPNENIRFHRSFNLGKTCPGILLSQAWLDNLLNGLSNHKPLDQKIKQKNLMAQVTRLQRLVDKLTKLINKMV